MNKLDYFLASIKSEIYLERSWGVAVFGIVPTLPKTLNLDITIADGELLYYKDAYVNNAIIPDAMVDGRKVSGYTTGKALYEINERVHITKTQLPWLTKDIDTTYGILFMNTILLWYPYVGAAPYINGEMVPKTLNDIAFNLLNTNVVDLAAHKRFENAVQFIAAFSQTAVPSATRKSITPNPAIPALKAKLLKENADKMLDPLAVDKVQKTLIAADRKYLKGDRSEGFLIKDKAFNTVRLRTYGMYGSEPDFDDPNKIKVITASLSEGWKKGDLVQMVNNIRGASYARGVSTALGGAEVKTTSRMFQNYKIEQDDCGSKDGLVVRLDNNNHSSFVGRTLVGQTKRLTLSQLQTKIGNTILVRSPTRCLTKGTGLCSICMGDSVSSSGVGINGLVNMVTSSFLNAMMELTHNSNLTLAKYDYKERIT